MGENNNNENNLENEGMSSNSMENENTIANDTSFLQSTPSSNEFTEPFDETANILPPSSKKPKGKKIPLLLLAVVLIAGAILSYGNRSYIVNQYMLMTKSPLEYYSYVENKNIQKGVDSFTEQYENSIAKYKNQLESGLSTNIDMNLSVSPEFSGMFGMGEIGNVNVTLGNSSKDGNQKATMAISYNNQLAATLNTYYLNETGQIYVQIPELSEAYLMYSFSDLASAYGESIPGITDIQRIETSILKGETSPETLNDLLKKYSKIVVDSVDSAVLDKNVETTVSDISNQYTKITATITQDNVSQMLTNILTEAKDDTELKALAVQLGITTEEEYTQNIEDTLNQLNENMDTAKDEVDSYNMIVYVDKKGAVMGHEFTTIDNSPLVGYILTRDGQEIGFTAYLGEDNVKIFDFTGNGEYQNGALTGKATLSVAQYSNDYDDYKTDTFDVAFENASLDQSNGYLNGSFNITSNLLTGIEISVEAKAENEQQDLLAKVMYGNIEALNLNITSKQVPYTDFTLPTDQDQVYDLLTDTYGYASTMDLQGFLSHLEDVLGINDLSSLLFGFPLY